MLADRDKRLMPEYDFLHLEERALDADGAAPAV